jgi:hypothetical protein
VARHRERQRDAGPACDFARPDVLRGDDDARADRALRRLDAADASVRVAQETGDLDAFAHDGRPARGAHVRGIVRYASA